MEYLKCEKSSAVEIAGGPFCLALATALVIPLTSLSHWYPIVHSLWNIREVRYGPPPKVSTF
jgi:hypothetical protein